jgi:hypothetical protein
MLQKDSYKKADLIVAGDVLVQFSELGGVLGMLIFHKALQVLMSFKRDRCCEEIPLLDDLIAWAICTRISTF